MKLACDACGTRYSIGDDRVAGKVFKIRCKKCSNVMVVRGAAADVPEAPSPPEIDRDEWYAVIEGVQSGPLSRVELVEKHANGDLDHDSYVWREGLAEWVTLGSLEELRGSLAAPSQPHADAVAAPMAGAEASPTTDTPRLLAERNESSVLFTLKNLADLAAPAPTPKAAKASAATGGATNGGTEGSGLIDIRALASTFAPATTAPTTAPKSIGSADDLPVYAPATFGEPIVLVPAPRPRTDRRLLVALLATLAMVVVLGVVLVVVLMRDPQSAEAAIPSAPQLAAVEPTSNADANKHTTHDIASDADAKRSTIASDVTPRTENPDAAKPITSDADDTAKPAIAKDTTPTKPAPRATPRTTPRTTTPSGPRTIVPRTAPTTPKLVPDKQPTSCTEVSCAFNDYKDPCCERFRPRTKSTVTTNAQLPDNLGRAQLTAGIATIRAQACGARSSARGDVSVSVKVSADGVVTGVTIKSSPDPALSACVIAAARKGTFAKTKRGGSFAYVWRF